MADLRAFSEEPENQLVQEPKSSHAHGEQPEKFPGQVQTITFSNSQHATPTQIQQAAASELGPWDLIVPVGADGLLITFNQDDATTATETGKRVVQKIDAALEGSCHSQIIDIRAKDGALHQKVLAKHGKVQNKPQASWVPLETPTTRDPAQSASAQETGTSASEEPSQTAQYETGYAPMWNIRNEVLMGFAVIPVIRMREGKDIFGRSVLGKSENADDLHELDTKMLRTQINTAADLLPKNLTSLLVSQIHFDTLSSSARRKEILQIAQQIPPYMRGNLMASIVDIPESTPASTLAQRLSGLPKYFRAVSITIPNSRFPIAACASMGATSVSYRIPDGPINEAVLAEAKKIILAAKSAKLLTTFEEVSDLNLAVALKKMGAVFITGECLGNIHTAPQNMKQLTVTDVQSGPLTQA
jgi:hypothetical protein